MSENQETKEETKEEQKDNNSLSNEEIKNMIKSWVETDEKIDALNKALKELKDEKKQYENFIIDYMEENHNIEVNSGGSRIKKAVQKTRAGFNEKVIIIGLTEITKGDESKAKEIAEKELEKTNLGLVYRWKY